MRSGHAAVLYHMMLNSDAGIELVDGDDSAHHGQARRGTELRRHSDHPDKTLHPNPV